MDSRDCLVHYPFVVVRIACVPARGAGLTVLLDWRRNMDLKSAFDLTDRFFYDCFWRAKPRSKKGKSACGVYLPDLEQPRPPDVPPKMVKLRLVKKAEG
jgi:hypothetical protein